FSNLRRLDPIWTRAQRDRINWASDQGIVSGDEGEGFRQNLVQSDAPGSLKAILESEWASEQLIISTCQAQLTSLGYNVEQTDAEKWTVTGLGSGVAYVHSTKELRTLAL